MSAPTFVEGNTPDFDNALFVEDWEGDPLEVEQVNELVNIYYRLVHRLWAMRPDFLNLVPIYKLAQGFSIRADNHLLLKSSKGTNYEHPTSRITNGRMPRYSVGGIP